MSFRSLRWFSLAALLVVTGPHPVSAQTAAPAVARASQTMGVGGLNSIRLYGSAASFQVGQNNNAEGPWPRTNLNDFNRWIDFAQPATRATAVTWAVPVTGGAAAQGAYNQVATPANPAGRYEA